MYVCISLCINVYSKPTGSSNCGENKCVKAHKFPGDLFELLEDQGVTAVEDIHHESAAKGVLHHFHAGLIVAHGIVVAPQHQGHPRVSPYREVELLHFFEGEIASRRQQRLEKRVPSPNPQDEVYIQYILDVIY